jgi:hypothetical protein
MERLHREGAGRCVDRGTAEGGRGAACGAAPDVGLPDFKLALFKLSFLQKIE